MRGGFPLKQSIKTQLVLMLALTVLLTVGLISVTSNLWIGRMFKAYKLDRQAGVMDEIASQLGTHYSPETDAWDQNFVHAIGMNAMMSGLMLRVTDSEGRVVWDADTCDQMACHEIMNDIIALMRERDPNVQGGFTEKTLPLMRDGRQVGSVSIGYYGPYYLDELDVAFLQALNRILPTVGAVSLIVAMGIGMALAGRVSRPIRRSAAAAQQIAKGDYGARVRENSGVAEVRELRDAVNHLAASLEAQEALRKRLTADVAHELRTPLTTLQTHLEAMTMGLWPPTADHLKSCHEETLRMGKLVDDLGNLAKVESETLSLDKTQVSLLDVFQKAGERFAMEAEAKNLTITVNGDAGILWADAGRMAQMADNLLSNAVKYTPESGAIRVFVERAADGWHVSVSDTGIGIAEEDLPHIFERFYRADASRSRLSGGSGIGLAVVKAIVTAHGGEISVASKVGEETVFVVKLPGTEQR